MSHVLATPRVFISYGHDTSAHRECVLSLSERLREDGVEEGLDTYVEGLDTYVKGTTGRPG